MLPCIPNFLEQLGIDFGVTVENRAKVGKKLDATYAFYLQNSPSTSLTQIVDDAQRKAVLEFDILEQKFESIFTQFILMAVIAIVIISLVGFYFIRDVSSSGWFLLLLLFITVVICSFIYYRIYQEFRTVALGFEKQVESLYSELVTQVSNYLVLEEAAINNAICYYGTIN